MSTLIRAVENFCTNYQDNDSIPSLKYFTEDSIRKSADKMNWNYISTYQHLSEDFIRESVNKVNWYMISKYQCLSEDFIREFQDRVDWICISIFQRLSENFIREFKDRVYWSYISVYQRLSEDFIREFKDKMNWHRISRCQRLSNEFIKEFKDNLDMKWIYDSWHYKSIDEKMKAVMDTGLYECHEDYFIAYKGIRADRYSNFNFQYQYIKGKIYETWCDCSTDEDSFGFSVWTEDKARAYCNELVVRVKVRYEDIGRVVHNGGKVRCFKIEILD